MLRVVMKFLGYQESSRAPTDRQGRWQQYLFVLGPLAPQGGGQPADHLLDRHSAQFLGGAGDGGEGGCVSLGDCSGQGHAAHTDSSGVGCGHSRDRGCCADEACAVQLTTHGAAFLRRLSKRFTSGVEKVTDNFRVKQGLYREHFLCWSIGSPRGRWHRRSAPTSRLQSQLHLGFRGVCAVARRPHETTPGRPRVGASAVRERGGRRRTRWGDLLRPAARGEWRAAGPAACVTILGAACHNDGSRCGGLRLPLASGGRRELSAGRTGAGRAS